MVIVIFGSGRLAFSEAYQQSINDEADLPELTLKRLEVAKGKFVSQALGRCDQPSDLEKFELIIVVEIGLNGEVARSWRNNDSSQDVCMQKLVNQHFYFRGLGRSFFTRIQYGSK